MKADKKEQKYDTSYVQMIRNNNVAAGKGSIEGYDTYFMLDYFDLLCHRKLTGDDKVYNKFWNINDGQVPKEWNYKAACKTLSLYRKSDGKDDIFELKKSVEGLSGRPFLGIIQIYFEHRVYQKELDVEEALEACEEEISNCIAQNGYLVNKEIDYRIYRSSTSGDFCLVIRSAQIKSIFKIATLLNNLTISYGGEKFRLNTYTNVGIECPVQGTFQEGRLNIKDEMIAKNDKCEFALRFTTGNDFATQIYDAITKEKNGQIKIGQMTGLFGRYDFLLYLPMADFARIYPALCKSKVVGGHAEKYIQIDDGNIVITELLKEGILKKEIKVINERVLVPLEEEVFHMRETEHSQIDCESRRDNENVQKSAGEDVQENNQEFIGEMKAFWELEKIFMEERRTFINIKRELLEVIRTYVPQGVENDSYVNWKILITDLKVIFKCINEWKISYEKLEDKVACKQSREKFFQDLRLDIDAINQYYKFLQNVNAQTWQAPLYEIQTQLDAEKMMVAYRELLYEYFSVYRSYCREQDREDERHKFYPLVYPDMSIDRACAMVPFLGEGSGRASSRLLVCRVPSFEYYGRMFDMVPWILHEASHSIRTMNRKKRNKFIVLFIVKAISLQMMYKLLNKYSNDFGYYDIGSLEKDIIEHMTQSMTEAFYAYCKEKSKVVHELETGHLETELLEFLYQIFDQDITNVEKDKGVRDIKAIQAALLCYAGELNLLNESVSIDKAEVVDGEIVNKKIERTLVEAVAGCEEGVDVFFAILKKIHDACYIIAFETVPSEDSWKLLRLESDSFDEILHQRIEDISVLKEQLEDGRIRDYLFKMRDLHRLYGTWKKSDKKDVGRTLRNKIWSACVLPIRRSIESGFARSEGFVELYRIFNMIFGSGESRETKECERIGDEWNILVQEEVYHLEQRAVTIYRETCADLYTAAALGFSAFGYCRQIFQTASDAGVENGGEWSEAVNIHRFRFVMAVLAGFEYNKTGGEKKIFLKKNAVWICMEKVLEQGEEYCIASLECARKKLNETESSQKKKAIQSIFDNLKYNIQDIFSLFTKEESVEESLEDSLLEYCLEPDRLKEERIKDIEDEEKKNLEEIRDIINPIQEELESLRHIMYRIKCFISLLNLVLEDGKIIIGKAEYEHFMEAYKAHWEGCKGVREKEVYKVVSKFYNVPQSALDKTHDRMLEDTLDFIQMYYYKNRFRIMLHEEGKGTR